MDSIKIKNITIQLDPNLIQNSPSGRPFRLSGISKNLQVPEKWVNRVLCNHWIYTFIYLDKEGGLVHFEFDYNDKFVCMLK